MLARRLALPSLLALAACSSSPTTPGGGSVNAIQAAHVLIAGVAVENTTVTGERGQTMFEIHMRDRDRVDVRMHYQVPGAGMGMMRVGDLACFDDGTHGDDVAGDGVYHYQDADDAAGCGRSRMIAGVYLYAFTCTTTGGAPCGQTSLTVTRG